VTTVTIDTADWRAFQARLKEADKSLATKVRRRLREAAEPLSKEVAEEGADAMPSGIVDYLKGNAKPRVSMTASAVQLVLQDRGKYGVQLAKLNEGNLRHPLFGRKKHWFLQSVAAESWTEAFAKRADDIKRELIDVLDDVAKEL